MINFEKGVLILDGQETPIKDEKVWWLGPTGLVTSRTMALEVHKALGMVDTPFFMAWKAIPVAIGENGQYEEIR